MEEVLGMLEKAKGTVLKGGGAFNDSTVIWFCAMSQYQPSDNVGPSMNEQLNLGTFERVIQSSNVKDMFGIQTSKFDPYSRFWCAIELGEAIHQEKKGDLQIHPLFSQEWLDYYVLDQEYEGTPKKFWEKRGENGVSKLITFYENGANKKPPALRRMNAAILPTANFFKNDIKKYYLMHRTEKGHHGGVDEPKLKTNCREVRNLHWKRED